MEDKKQKMRPVRMDDALYEKVKKRADDMGLTFSSYVRMILTEATK